VPGVGVGYKIASVHINSHQQQPMFIRRSPQPGKMVTLNICWEPQVMEFALPVTLVLAGIILLALAALVTMRDTDAE